MLKAPVRISWLLLIAATVFFVGSNNFVVAKIKAKPKYPSTTLMAGRAVKGVTMISSNNSAVQLQTYLATAGATLSKNAAGQVTFIEAAVGPNSQPIPLSTQSLDPQTRANNFWTTYAPVFSLQNSGETMASYDKYASQDGLTYYYAQAKYQGVPLLGGAAYVVLDKNNNITSASAHGWTLVNQPNTTPTLSAAEATKIAVVTAVQDGAKNPKASTPQLAIYNAKYYDNADGVDNNVLVWTVDTGDATVSRFLVIDQAGKVLQDQSNVEYNENRKIYNCIDQTVGGDDCNDDSQSLHPDSADRGMFEGDSVFGDDGYAYASVHVINAYVRAEQIHDYYQSTFGIDGANGQGGITPKNVLEVNPDLDRNNVSIFIDAISDETGEYYSSIPSDGGAAHIILGRSDFSNGSELLAHEYTHAVFAANKLDHGIREGGALNEGLADFFAIAWYHNYAAANNYTVKSFDWGFNPDWKNNYLTIFDSTSDAVNDYEHALGNLITHLAYYLTYGSNTAPNYQGLPGMAYSGYPLNDGKGPNKEFCSIFPLDPSPAKSFAMVQDIFFNAMYTPNNLRGYDWLGFYNAADSYCKLKYPSTGYPKVCSTLERAMQGAQLNNTTDYPDYDFCGSAHSTDSLTDQEYCQQILKSDCGLVTRNWYNGSTTSINCGNCDSLRYCVIAPLTAYERSHGYQANTCAPRGAVAGPGGNSDINGNRVPGKSGAGGNYKLKQIFASGPTYVTENLNTGAQTNNPQVQSNGQKYCYDNSDGNCNLYGGLYQWCGQDSCSFNCPAGFRAMDYADFDKLKNDPTAKPLILSADGFNATLSGYYDSAGNKYLAAGQSAKYWEADGGQDSDKTIAWSAIVNSDGAISHARANRKDALSVRCIEACKPAVGGHGNTWQKEGTCVNGWQTQTNVCDNPAPSCGGTCPITATSTRQVACDLSTYPGAAVTADDGPYASVYIAGQNYVQHWLTVNLASGKTLDQNTDVMDSANGKYCYNGDCSTYGGYYPGLVPGGNVGFSDPCPVGWAMPNESDLTQLLTIVGDNAGQKIMTQSSCQGQGIAGDCAAAGFNLLPAGQMQAVYKDNNIKTSGFSGQTKTGSFWVTGSGTAQPHVPHLISVDFSSISPNGQAVSDQTLDSSSYTAAPIRCIDTNCSPINGAWHYTPAGQCKYSSGQLYNYYTGSCGFPTDFNLNPHCGGLTCPKGGETQWQLAPTKDQPTMSNWLNAEVCGHTLANQVRQTRICQNINATCANASNACAGPTSRYIPCDSTSQCNSTLPGLQAGAGGPYDVTGRFQTDPTLGGYYLAKNVGSQCWLTAPANIGTMINPENGLPCTANSQYSFLASAKYGRDYAINDQKGQGNDSQIQKYCYSYLGKYDNNGNSDTDYSDYNQDESTYWPLRDCAADGGLYQWSEATQQGYVYQTKVAGADKTYGICPSGWHIPSLTDTQVLLQYFQQNSQLQPTDYFSDPSTGWIPAVGINQYYFGGSVYPMADSNPAHQACRADETYSSFIGFAPYDSSLDQNKSFNFWTSYDNFSDSKLYGANVGRIAVDYYDLKNNYHNNDLSSAASPKSLAFPVYCVQDKAADSQDCQGTPPVNFNGCYIIGAQTVELNQPYTFGTTTFNYDSQYVNTWSYVDPRADSQVVGWCRFTCAPGCSYQNGLCAKITLPCRTANDCNNVPPQTCATSSTSTVRSFQPLCDKGQCVYKARLTKCQANQHCDPNKGYCVPNDTVTTPYHPNNFFASSTTAIPYNPPTPGYVTPPDTGPTPPVTPTGPANQNCLGAFPPVPTNYVTQFKFGKPTSANPVAWFYDCSLPMKDCAYCCLNNNPSGDLINCNGSNGGGGATGAVKGVKIQKTWWQNILQWIGL